MPTTTRRFAIRGILFRRGERTRRRHNCCFWRTNLDSEALANKAVDILSDRLALDLAMIDISKTSSFTDYFVIATAQSPLQFSALQEYLEKGFKEEGVEMRHKEGTPEGGWVLLDFYDVIVHLFTEERRTFYRLEELWGKTSPVTRFTG